MTTVPYLIGIDPGETTGIVTWAPDDFPPILLPTGFIQCNAAIVLPVLHGLITRRDQVLCIERFVVSHRAGRSLTPDAGKRTRQLIDTIKAVFHNCRIIERRAVDVKPWATDERLKAAGLYSKMPHTRDAARHALFAACQDFGMCDPLSVKARN